MSYTTILLEEYTEIKCHENYKVYCMKNLCVKYDAGMSSRHMYYVVGYYFLVLLILFLPLNIIYTSGCKGGLICISSFT